MYKHVGYKIQKIAVIFNVIGALAAIGAAVWCYTKDILWAGSTMETGLKILICVGIAIGGVLLSWLLSLPAYAYGRIAECVEEIADTHLETEKKLTALTDIVEHLPVLRVGTAASSGREAKREAEVKQEAETAFPREKHYFSETPVGVREWICPECGKRNPPAEEKCISCGAGGLWQCKKCGKVSTYNLDICPECGTTDNYRCRSCGELNPRNSQTCAKCGKPLQIGEQ